MVGILLSYIFCKNYFFPNFITKSPDVFDVTCMNGLIVVHRSYCGQFKQWWWGCISTTLSSFPIMMLVMLYIYGLGFHSSFILIYLYKGPQSNHLIS